MFAIYFGACLAVVSLLFLRRDPSAVRALKHKRALQEVQQQKLRDRRKKDYNKYRQSGEEATTLSDKFLQTLTTESNIDLQESIKKMLIDFMDKEPDSVTKWMKWAKILLFIVLFIVILGLAAYLVSVYQSQETDKNIVDMVKDAVVSVYPKINGTDQEM